MSLYVEIGLKPESEIDIDEELRKTIEGLKKAQILHDEKLISWHSVVMNPAYVHVSKTGLKEVTKQKTLLEKNKIYSIGRYGSWIYSSIEDNMIEAKSLAESIK